MGQPNFDMQQMKVKKAYRNVTPKVQEKIEVKDECNDLFEGIEVDAGDRLYVQIRTVMDSWIFWSIFLAGILAVAPFFLKKIGINIRSPFEINRKGK